MSAVLRLAAALAAAAGVLLAGAWSGGALAGSGPDAARAGGYPRGGAEVAVGDSLEASGQPMRVSVFHTPDAPAAVITFYADAFRARGLLPVVSVDEAFAHVAVFDPGDGLQRFVSALRGPFGQTLAMTGVADPRRPARLLEGAEGASMPLPREHRRFLGFRSSDGAGRAESAHFESDLPPAGIAAFYREALAKEGYTEVGGPGPALITFGKKGSTFTLAAARAAAANATAVFVTRIEGEPR